MNEIKELVEELRNKKSRDNRELLDRSANMIERLAKELCDKSGCHHKCNDTTDCVVEDEAQLLILKKHLHSALTNEEKVSEKDKLLLINENKSNNSDFKSNNFDVKSNEELFKQALVEGLNRRFDREIEEAKKIEQIEEMVMELAEAHHEMDVAWTNYFSDCEKFPKPKTEHLILAEHLYNAGYRKQSEGEWVPSDIPQEKYVCSVCGGACWYYDFEGEVAKSRYCPNCGARMSGGKK